MPFFTFDQNNSGGGFHYDAARGISVNVIVEADDHEDANRRAKRIGLYFDGWGDCDRCGNRWYSQTGSEDADAVPSIYGEPVDAYEPIISWMKNGAFNAFVHYKDGRITGHLPGPKSPRY